MRTKRDMFSRPSEWFSRKARSYHDPHSLGLGSGLNHDRSGGGNSGGTTCLGISVLMF